jgi:pimeloyl-ACP methyl ester carboxylesterase
MFFYYLGGILGGLLLIFLAILLYCFFRVFYSKKRRPLKPDEYEIESGGEYDKHYDQMLKWQKASRELPHEEVETKSYDGLTLRGRYYEFEKGAPVEILLNGYRGTAERDMSGGIERCFAVKHNALVVNQRGCGPSDGHVITFGIKEEKDCISWINFAIERFGKDVKLILAGISMGGATVLGVTNKPLPENVKYVLADCPFSSAKEIICKVVKEMKLPPKLVYPFIRLSGIIFGGFDVESNSPLKAMETCNLPIILFHGEKDGFVPCEMSKQIYEKCKTKKSIYLVPTADHGLAYPEDIDGYAKALDEFCKEINL